MKILNLTVKELLNLVYICQSCCNNKQLHPFLTYTVQRIMLNVMKHWCLNAMKHCNNHYRFTALL